MQEKFLLILLIELKKIRRGQKFRLMGAIEKRKGSGTFEFASSNELWRASLDIIDFMPLAGKLWRRSNYY